MESQISRENREKLESFTRRLGGTEEVNGGNERNGRLCVADRGLPLSLGHVFLR